MENNLSIDLCSEKSKNMEVGGKGEKTFRYFSVDIDVFFRHSFSLCRK